MSAPVKHRAGFIAICGRTNAGKSTLLNRLVGTKIAAVSSRPQTTRTRILGIRSDPEAQMIFLDMPGIHDSKRPMNRRMTATARRAIAEGEIIVAVIAPRGHLDDSDRAILSELRKLNRSLIVAINKIDLGARDRLLPVIEEVARIVPESEVIPISALTGENVDDLVATLKHVLPEGPSLMPEDEITDQTERTLAAEIVREKVFAAMRQEVPFSTAVLVEEFEDDVEGRIKRIRAAIVVERDAHKAMVIGAGAQTLKKIGIAARLELEKMLDSRIHLALNVRVDRNWTRNPSKLEEYGL